jgi:putative ATPase
MQKPLAEQLRPTSLESFIGQTHLFETGSPIRGMVDSRQPRSMILQGPPGTGKTTLARLISKEIDAEFVELSAIDSGVKEIREVSKKAIETWQTFNRHTILFLDEIHRFSKSQQDSLLKATENGTISLFGATTENPSFALNPAMLSRTLVIRLNSLSDEELSLIANSAIKASAKTVDPEALELLIMLSGGDARRLISIVELSSDEITVESVKSVQSKVQLHYDRAGDNHYQTISAFIKSVRGSDVNAALHYLAVMLVGGEDPMFVARRLAILASEDVGLANPNAINAASATMNIVTQIGMPEAKIPLAQLTIMLSLSGKSNSSYVAINQAIADVENGLTPSIPDAQIPRGKGYLYPHDYENRIVSQSHSNHSLPDYYQPVEIDGEKSFAERYLRIQQILNKGSGF